MSQIKRYNEILYRATNKTIETRDAIIIKKIYDVFWFNDYFVLLRFIETTFSQGCI